MYSFRCDYSEGAHPRILKALTETNCMQTEGYGEDPFTCEAKNCLKKIIGKDDLSIHLIPGRHANQHDRNFRFSKTARSRYRMRNRSYMRTRNRRCRSDRA